MQKIFIVEDDKIISGQIEKHFKAWDWEVFTVKDFRQVMSDFASFAPQIVILDIGLPFFDGYHWCNEIRKVSKVPIIFISSASDNMNIVMAMNMGADDFIAKPFDMNVLSAKVQAVFRRTYEFSDVADIIEHRGAILSLSDATLRYRDEPVDLTRNEYGILKTLLYARGEVVSRETIMENLWQSENFIDDNTLTVNVTRLRKKLDDVGLTDFIKTKKGMGYLVD